MRTWKEYLRHAFAVEQPAAVQPTERQRELVERLCRNIVRRHLTLPAVTVCEMTRPLNYLAAQAMHFFAPLASMLLNREDYREVASFLEQRDALDYIAQRLEAIEREATRQDAASHPTETSR